MRASPARLAGVTLIELIVVMVLIGILAVVAIPPIQAALRARSVVASGVQAVDELRYAAERIARELRQVRWVENAGLDLQLLSAGATSSAGICFNRIGSSPQEALVPVVIGTQSGQVMLDYLACNLSPTRSLLPPASSVSFSYGTFAAADGARLPLSTADTEFRTKLRYIDITVARTVEAGTYSHTTSVLLRDAVWGH